MTTSNNMYFDKLTTNDKFTGNYSSVICIYQTVQWKTGSLLALPDSMGNIDESQHSRFEITFKCLSLLAGAN
jgi:hypothetical protein